MPLTFGVEIEFLVSGERSREWAADQLTQITGLSISGGYRGTPNPNNWKVVLDGSVLQMGRQGLELVSPPLTDDRIGEIDKVCHALSRMGATVNRTCGLHVHIGARSLPLDAMKRLAILYAEGEQFVDALLPPSRRGNTNEYCRSVKANLRLQTVLDAREVADIARGIYNGQRYLKLNFTSFWKHGTVEFRQHSGTIDPEKIKNWVKLCAAFVSTAARETDPALQPVSATFAMPSAAVPNPVEAPLLPIGSYWASGRRTRTIFRMLNRPEGCTAQEVQEVLGVSTRPDIRWHIERSGDSAQYTHRGYRDGRAVYVNRRIVPAPAAAPVPVVPARPVVSSLEGLMDRLAIGATERTYWIERASLLNEAS